MIVELDASYALSNSYQLESFDSKHTCIAKHFNSKLMPMESLTGHLNYPRGKGQSGYNLRVLPDSPNSRMKPSSPNDFPHFPEYG
jgi:hypothetical protein